MRRSPRARGFTLIEAALVIVIIGVAVVAMLELLAAGTRSNAGSRNETTGLTVAKSAREFLLSKTFAELAALSNHNYAPAVDATGATMDTFGDDWQQTVQVVPVRVGNLLASNTLTAPAALRVTVHAVRNGERVASLTWYQFAVPTAG